MQLEDISCLRGGGAFQSSISLMLIGVYAMAGLVCVRRPEGGGCRLVVEIDGVLTTGILT